MNGISAYREHNVTMQSPGRLIVMLYEGAIRFLTQAIAAMEADDHQAKSELMGKALDVIVELNCSLDVSQGGQVASSLRSLYNFMHRHLSQALARSDPRMVREVIALLTDLNDGWKAICT